MPIRVTWYTKADHYASRFCIREYMDEGCQLARLGLVSIIDVFRLRLYVVYTLKYTIFDPNPWNERNEREWKYDGASHWIARI